MDTKLKSIIQSCPYVTSFSNFEQENFHSPSSAGYPRYIIGLVNRIRKIESDLESETRSFEKNCLLEEKNKIESVLEAQDLTKLENAVNNWEMVEADYWADRLGKIAAIEILSHGKTTYDTLIKMAQLPEESYIKATQICVRLANKIKETTVQAEEAIGINVPFDDAPEPKKLVLQKTK